MRPNKNRWPLLLSVLALAVVGGAFALFQSGLQALRTHIEQALGPDSEVQDIRVGLTGVEIIGLRINAPAPVRTGAAAWPATDQLRAGRILIIPSYMDLLMGRITLDSIRVENGYLALLRTREGKMRLLPSLLEAQAAGSAGKATGATGAADAAQETPPTLTIDRIELTNSTIELFDATVRTPPHKLRLEQINAAVTRVRLPELKGVSALDLVGTLKGVKQDGKVSLSGTIEFATRESGLTTRMRDIDLLALQPYLVKAAETGVKRGTLDLDLNTSVKKGKLHAPGALTLRDLELSSTAGTLLGMSRNTLLGAMKRSDGTITLRFTIDGNIDDPHFSLNDSLAKRLASSLANSLGVNMEGLARSLGGLGAGAAKGIGDSVNKLIGK